MSRTGPLLLVSYVVRRYGQDVFVTAGRVAIYTWADCTGEKRQTRKGDEEAGEQAPHALQFSPQQRASISSQVNAPKPMISPKLGSQITWHHLLKFMAPITSRYISTIHPCPHRPTEIIKKWVEPQIITTSCLHVHE